MKGTPKPDRGEIILNDAYSKQEADRWNRDGNKLATCATSLESPI
jgi:hypothetical protein